MKRLLLLHRGLISIVIGSLLLLGLPACGSDEPVGSSASTRTTTTEPESITMDPPVQARPRPTPAPAPPVPDPPVPEPDPPPLETVAYGPDRTHRIDIHRPATPNGLAVLWLHSGGWTSGTRTETGPVVDHLCDEGAIVFSADYRLTPNHPFPAQIHDVKRAIRYLKAHRADFPFETLIVAGGSSGGHLAALAATSAGDLEPPDLPRELAEQDSRVDGAVSLSGIMDLTRFWTADHGWAKPLSDGFLGCDSASCDPTVMLEASPAHWVDVNDPPLFLVAGAGDTLVTPADNADRMWAAMEREGAPGRCWYDLLENAEHMLYEDFDPARVDQFLIHFGLLDPPSVQPGV
jgi:acetyl esterase/lipase